VTTGIQLTYLYHDADIVELRITINNGRFSGSPDVYVATGQLTEAADALAGFPTHPQDTRDYTFGTFGSEFAGGAVRLQFYCRDLAGHPSIEDDHSKLGYAQRAEVVLDFDPAALDRFLTELREVEHNHGSASLIQ
jgi:hypothetical protein